MAIVDSTSHLIFIAGLSGRKREKRIFGQSGYFWFVRKYRLGKENLSKVSRYLKDGFSNYLEIRYKFYTHHNGIYIYTLDIWELKTGFNYNSMKL